MKKISDNLLKNIVQKEKFKSFVCLIIMDPMNENLDTRISAVVRQRLVNGRVLPLIKNQLLEELKAVAPPPVSPPVKKIRDPAVVLI